MQKDEKDGDSEKGMSDLSGEGGVPTTEGNEIHKTDEDDALFDADDDIDWKAVDNRVKEINKCPGHSVTFPIGK